MPGVLPFVLAGLGAAGLVVWGVTAQRRKRRAREETLARLGFSPCPDRGRWLEETAAGIENTRGQRYEVRDPRLLAGASPVYHYVKRRHRGDDAHVEEELLFAVKRPSAEGLILVVKPSRLAPGFATRVLGALATGVWGAQPHDLRRLELPVDLRDTNLVGALGPPGRSLYDLVDARTLAVVQGLGDAGATFVRFRDTWCAVAGASARTPFRLDELLPRIRPLL